MSVYRDSRYDRTELTRKQYLRSGHSSENLIYHEPITKYRNSDPRYSGRSLDRLQNEERQTSADLRYNVDERAAIRFPVGKANFGSQHQASIGSSLPLDRRIPRQLENQDVPLGTGTGASSSSRYPFHGRNSGQSRPREGPTGPPQPGHFAPGYSVGQINPRPFQVRGAPSLQQQESLVSHFADRNISQIQRRGVIPSPSFNGARQPVQGPRQEIPQDQRQNLVNGSPQQYGIGHKPSVYPLHFDERNRQEFQAGQNNIGPQQLIPFQPSPNGSGLGMFTARQGPSIPRQVPVDERRNKPNNVDRLVYNVGNVNRNSATVALQNIETTPAPYRDGFIQEGAMIGQPSPHIGSELPGPEQDGYRQNDQHNLIPPTITFPQGRQPHQSHYHPESRVAGSAIILHPHAFQGQEPPMKASTMHPEFVTNPQTPLRESGVQMMPTDKIPSTEEVSVLQIEEGHQVEMNPDNPNYTPMTTKEITQGASVVDSNMEELISQLPSRSNRIISVQGILQHQHQEQHRRKLSRSTGPPEVAPNDGSSGHLPEEPEISATEAQEELQTLREEANPLIQRRLRRRHLLHLIQKETSSPTQEFVASISSVAHTSEDVLSSAFDKINFVNLVKKTMEAEAGASVAAVFDLCSDLLRLNILLAIILLSSIVIPSLVWTDDVSFVRQGVSSRSVVDCGNFSNNFVMDRDVEDYDQVWGWLTHANFVNESSFVCSGAALCPENLQVAICSAYYVLQQECYSEDRNSFIDYVLDFLQGKGFLERTPIFVGWYPAKLTGSPDSYIVHLAYALAVMFAYAVSIWYAVRGFARWLKTQREILDFTHLYNNMIFRGWDCNIANEKTATIEKKLLATEIQAAQWEEKCLDIKQNRTVTERRILFMTRSIIHLVVLGLIGAGWTAIYYVVVRTTGDSFWEEYAATMTIGALNFVLPLIFFRLSKFEQYRSKDELLLFIIRNIFVRLISIMILAVSEISSTIRREDDARVCNTEATLCWETKLAQQIYSLIIFDTLLYFPLAVVVVVRNWLRKVPSEAYCIQWIPKPVWTFLSNPEFDTSGQVLRVVHVQTLCWMGLVCAPMIPLITSISFMIMILLNGATIFFCNLRPLTVFRASRSSSTFTGAILIGLVVSMIPSALVFTWLRPSLGCSPFRGLDYAYQAIVFEICRTPQWIQDVLFFLDNFVALGLVLLVLVLALVYFIAKAQAAAAQIKTCEKRLKMVARDKRRLVNFTKVLYTH